MLVIKVEIWPSGNERAARELGKVGLANASRLAELSDYLLVRFDDTGSTEAGKLEQHRRGDGFWPLLAAAATPESWAELTEDEARVVEDMLETLRGSN